MFSAFCIAVEKPLLALGSSGRYGASVADGFHAGLELEGAILDRHCIIVYKRLEAESEGMKVDPEAGRN